MGAQIRDAILEAAREKSLALQVPQIGSMFAIFFAEKPVRNLHDATTSHTKHFKQLFKYALDHGVYLPPSPYETCFISTAHGGYDIEQAAEILADGIRSI